MDNYLGNCETNENNIKHLFQELYSSLSGGVNIPGRGDREFGKEIVRGIKESVSLRELEEYKRLFRQVEDRFENPEGSDILESINSAIVLREQQINSKQRLEEINKGSDLF